MAGSHDAAFLVCMDSLLLGIDGCFATMNDKYAGSIERDGPAETRVCAVTLHAAYLCGSRQS